MTDETRNLQDADRLLEECVDEMPECQYQPSGKCSVHNYAYKPCPFERARAYLSRPQPADRSDAVGLLNEIMERIRKEAYDKVWPYGAEIDWIARYEALDAAALSTPALDTCPACAAAHVLHTGGGRVPAPAPDTTNTAHKEYICAQCGNRCELRISWQEGTVTACCRVPEYHERLVANADTTALVEALVIQTRLLLNGRIKHWLRDDVPSHEPGSRCVVCAALAAHDRAGEAGR